MSHHLKGTGDRGQGTGDDIERERESRERPPASERDPQPFRAEAEPEPDQRTTVATGLTELEPDRPDPNPSPKPIPKNARAAILMREAGADRVNPSHPDLIAALAEGCTPEELADAVTEAGQRGIGDPFRWAITTARNRRSQVTQRPPVQADPTMTKLSPINGHRQSAPASARGGAVSTLLAMAGEGTDHE